MNTSRLPTLVFRPLTASRWKDFERLFGERGGYAGCWCMFWRLPGPQWDRQRGAGNRRALRKLSRSRRPPGLIAYAEGEAVGWASVGPRADFARLARSRTLKPVDERVTWSVNCFYVARPFRSSGVMTELLKAAVAYAQAHGAEVVEGYPVEPRAERVAAVEVYTGTVRAFRRAGFRKIRRRVEGEWFSRYVYAAK
jgi:GNAT superfamily N-acetyltransferase